MAMRAGRGGCIRRPIGGAGRLPPCHCNPRGTVRANGAENQGYTSNAPGVTLNLASNAVVTNPGLDVITLANENHVFNPRNDHRNPRRRSFWNFLPLLPAPEKIAAREDVTVIVPRLKTWFSFAKVITSSPGFVTTAFRGQVEGNPRSVRGIPLVLGAVARHRAAEGCSGRVAAGLRRDRAPNATTTASAHRHRMEEKKECREFIESI